MTLVPKLGHSAFQNQPLRFRLGQYRLRGASFLARRDLSLRTLTTTIAGRSATGEAAQAAGAGAALRVSLSAGLGAFFVLLLYEGAAEFAHLPRREKLNECLTLALVCACFFAIVEPVIERLQRMLGMTPRFSRHVGAERFSFTLTALILLLLVSISHAFIHGVLGQRFAAQGLFVALEQILIGDIAGPAVVTWFWIRGARLKPPRAAILGLVSALVLAALPLIILIAQTLELAPDPHRSWAAKLALLRWGFLSAFLLPLPMIALGGGLAIDRRWFARPGRAMGPVIAFALVIYLAYFLCFVPQAELKLLLPTLVPAFGWWLGLMLRPETDALLAK